MLSSLLIMMVIKPIVSEALFLRQISSSVFGPDRTLQRSCEAAGGRCTFDLQCRLSYGHRMGECGGFYQVCCAPGSRLSPTFRGGRQFSGSSGAQVGKVTSEKQCGKPAIAARRVVGGTEAGFGSFPWMALVRGSRNRCGGALVRSNWVITAGHCVRDHASIFSSRYRVYLGEYSLYQKTEPLPRQKFLVDQVVLHPLYKFTPQADRYDVALLKLDRPATLMPHVSPICLPAPKMDSPVGVRGYVAGWGATDPESINRPKVLQAVDVVTVDSRQCEEWHKDAGIRMTIYPEMLCAGHREGGRDACQGDSGGPLMTKDDSGRWTLIGLVSAGYSCAKPGQPGIYHRVSETADWISHVTSKDDSDNSVK